MINHIFEICKNGEGDTSVYAYIEGKDNGYRISGPKAWGGSRTILKIKIKESDLLSYILQCSPEIVKRIKELTDE